MSFPFFHWPLPGDVTLDLSICWLMEDGCNVLDAPGGRGSGCPLALLPSCPTSNRDLWYDCSATPVCFLVIVGWLFDVGLWSGEWSGLCEMRTGEACKEHVILSKREVSKGDEALNEEWKKSTVLNLFGLRTGLDKPLLGALLAGASSLKLYRTPSTLSSLGNPLRR